jgi:hypothetical protein
MLLGSEAEYIRGESEPKVYAFRRSSDIEKWRLPNVKRLDALLKTKHRGYDVRGANRIPFRRDHSHDPSLSPFSLFLV